MLLEYTEIMNRSIKSHIPYHRFWIILKFANSGGSNWGWSSAVNRSHLWPSRPSSENWVRQFWQKSSDRRATEGHFGNSSALLCEKAQTSPARLSPPPIPPAPLPETLYWDAQQQPNWTHNHCCFPTKQVDNLRPWRINWGNTFKWSGVSFIIVLHYINNREQKSLYWGLILCRPISSIPVAWWRFSTFASFSNMHS